MGEDTTISQIVKMVSDASATKAPVARLADKVSGIFVPTVIGIALLTLAVGLLSAVISVLRWEEAISVLVISCPCALGLCNACCNYGRKRRGAKNRCFQNRRFRQADRPRQDRYA